MKRIVLSIILLVACSFAATAQITVAQVQPRQMQRSSACAAVIFDSSLTYMTADNLINSAWQIFYLPVLSTNEGIVPLDIKASSGDKSKYYGYVGKHHQRSVNNKFEGRYYVVTNVCMKQMKGKGDYIIVDLSEKDNPANQWKYATKAVSEEFPFIVLSHYNYLKSTYLGNEQLFKHPYLDKCRDIEGKPIEISADTLTIWRCSEISVAQVNYGEEGLSNKIIIIYSNGNQSFYIEEEECGKEGISRELWDDITSRYPIEYCNVVLEQRVRIGMPLELLELSLGKPKKVNERAYNDIQYIYDGLYVIIREGVVTNWQVY